MSLPTTDPFSDVHDALWARLILHPTIASLVKPGNRIKFTGDQGGAQKTNTNDADKPMVQIVQSGFNFVPWATNTTSEISQNYAIQLFTSDMRMNIAGKIKFAILCSLESLRNITSTLSYVEAVNFASGSDQLEDGEKDNGTPGWSTVLTIIVKMNFDRGDMDAAAVPTP